MSTPVLTSRVGGHRPLVGRLGGRWSAWYVIPAVIAGIGIAAFLRTRWGGEWSGYDLAVYLRAADHLLAGESPYLCAAGEPCYLYSPVFAGLAAPLAILPPELALILWRIGSWLTLAVAVRGMGLAGLAILVLPWIWVDLLVGNVTTLAMAAMVTVVRRPSVRAVVAYALFVALIPKPQFLPVLLWGLWTVREAIRPVAIVGLLGLAMLAWPGYLDNAIRQTAVIGWGQVQLPLWIHLAVPALLVASLRQPRLLGVSTVLAAPFWWGYTYAHLGLTLVASGRVAERRWATRST